MLDIEDVLVGDTVYSVDFNTNEVLTHEVFDKIDYGRVESSWQLVTMVIIGEHQSYDVTLSPSDAFKTFDLALHTLLRVRGDEVDATTKTYFIMSPF